MHASTESRLPTGTVTFLFTDIEGSTRLLETLGEDYGPLLESHTEALRASVDAHEGIEVATEGDALFAVFRSALGAVSAAAQAQRRLAELSAGRGVEVRVRMGLHTGEGRRGGDNYVGMDVHRAARIAAAGHGGQVLLSDTTRALVQADLSDGLDLRDLGNHRLKDLPAPERLWQLDVAGLPHDFPAPRSLDARPGNLPVRLTPLVGREHELEVALELLASRRLLVLTGPGGAGKTRLALAVAYRRLAAFADGTFFVSLEDAHDRAAVLTAIASALGVREQADRDVEKVIADFLRSRELLLVLDNFEQVVSAAPLVSELVAAAPRISVVVTSRAVLNLEGEQDYEVPPLGLPDPGVLASGGDLTQYDAVALFIERAVAVKSDFRVTNANAPAVAEICSRLDGLPLAIELAAARVRLLAPEAILARLRDRLPALGGGPRDAPARQRTLEGTVDWSFELLPDAERRLFARLGVFAGGWDLAAVESVCEPAADLGLDALDGLASLVDNSLIQSTAEPDDDPRFRMLHVIHEFALDRLGADPEAEAVRRRHALHLLGVVEAAEPELVRTEIPTRQRRLRRDEENIRVALRWAVEHGDAEIGLGIAGSLWQFWHYWARLREGRSWLEAVLELPAPAGTQRARAKALSALAAIDYWQGDARHSAERYEEALAIYRRLGDRLLVAETLYASAWAAIARNEVEDGLARGRAALEAYRAAGDEAGVRNVDAWLRSAPYIMGMGSDPDQALAAVDDAIEINRRLGRMHDVADALSTRAFILRVADRPGLADALRESMGTWAEIGNQGRLVFFRLIARLELEAGRPERAVTLGAAGERAREQVGGELPDSMTRAGDPVEDARPLLDPEVFERAYRDGGAMTIEQAMAFALQPTE